MVHLGLGCCSWPPVSPHGEQRSRCPRAFRLPTLQTLRFPPAVTCRLLQWARTFPKKRLIKSTSSCSKSRRSSRSIDYARAKRRKRSPPAMRRSQGSLRASRSRLSVWPVPRWKSRPTVRLQSKLQRSRWCNQLRSPPLSSSPLRSTKSMCETLVKKSTPGETLSTTSSCGVNGAKLMK